VDSGTVKPKMPEINLLIDFPGRYKLIISILDKSDRDRYFSILVNQLISEIDNIR